MTRCRKGDVPNRRLRYKSWPKYDLLTLIWVAFWTKRFVLIGQRLEHIRIKWLINLMYNMLMELLNKPLVACKFKCHDLVLFHKFHNVCMNCKIWIIYFFITQGLRSFCCRLCWVFERWITSTKWWTWCRITPQKICCSFIEIWRNESSEVVRNRR